MSPDRGKSAATNLNPAEHCRWDVTAPVTTPEDWIQAAVLPLVTITAWEALYERAGVIQGEYVLIHAGAGGTGHVAVQLAALNGAHVGATVSNETKAAFVRKLGVDRP
jgi:NADPH2:quinone reductase